jgi:predicted nucleic acid-binding protein
MNLVDATGWLEYVADGPNAGFFAPAIEKTADLVVPTVVILEVFRHLVRQAGEGPALEVAAAMRQGIVVDLDATIALEAARLCTLHQFDAVTGTIVAVAGMHEAVIWSSDRRLVHLANIRFRESRATAG